jgi:hypothetical protein
MVARPPRRLVGLRRGLVAVGLAIGGLMVARGQVGGDQLNLLARGWLLAARGEWVHYGNPLSSGGNAPGTVTTLLMAAPLMVWRDARAPAALLLALHLAAYLLIDRLLARAAGERARLACAALYWLNPWQLYFTGFVWNPSFLFLAGAVHLWTAWRQRRRAGFGLSFLHVLTLGLAGQVHPSALLLMVASLLLWWRGLLRLDLRGAALGLLATVVSLVPWWLAVRGQPAIAAASEGFLLRGLVTGVLLKGVLYWLRYASLHLSNKIAVFDFSSLVGPALDRTLVAAAAALRHAAGVASGAVPVLANLWLWRRGPRGLLRRPRAQEPARPAAGDRAGAAGERRGARLWLKRYVAWCFVAALAVFALSPTTLQMWQGLVLLHAAVLPVVLWWELLARSRRRRDAWRGLTAWTALEVGLLLALAFGSPYYRPGGRAGVHLALRADSPMLHELRIVPRTPNPLGRRGGWWPDVLPEE